MSSTHQKVTSTTGQVVHLMLHTTALTFITVTSSSVDKKFFDAIENSSEKLAIIAVVVCLPVIIGIIFAIGDHAREGQERIEKEQQKQVQIQEEIRLKEEEERALQAYDEEVIAVSGINEVVQKDRYYSIQVTDVVPYELNYDHNSMDWGSGILSEPHLLDNEHRVAVHIKVKNYQDRMAIYGNPSSAMKLYIEDENEESLVIQEHGMLNGSSDDNYYSGGCMISDNDAFSDNYGKSIEKNQTMSWWVPVVVNESTEKIVLHFDYNMSITVDNPCYR